MLKKISLFILCFLGMGYNLFAQQKQSTANKNVQIVDTAFFIPQLNRHRRISVYLPATYTTAKKKYPVIYMHDGQNIFEKNTSVGQEWGVDEAMDTLGLLAGESIIVAIDNVGDKNAGEYAPYNFESKPVGDPGVISNNIKAEGEEYVSFLVKTLRPYINKNYRTKKCRKHTYTAGSAMGGVISLYALVTHPKIFGGAGVFSPSFWAAPQLAKEIEQGSKKIKGKIYLYAGKLDGKDMVPHLLTIFNSLNKYTKARVTTVIRAEGKMDESSWREEFPLFYKWLLH